MAGTATGEGAAAGAGADGIGETQEGAVSRETAARGTEEGSHAIPTSRICLHEDPNLQEIRRRFGYDAARLVRHVTGDTGTLQEMENVIDETAEILGTNREGVAAALDLLFTGKQVSPREEASYHCRNTRALLDDSPIYLSKDEELVVDDEDNCYKYEDLKSYRRSSVTPDDREIYPRFKSPYTNKLFSEVKPKFIGNPRFRDELPRNIKQMFDGSG